MTTRTRPKKSPYIFHPLIDTNRRRRRLRRTTVCIVANTTAVVAFFTDDGTYHGYTVLPHSLDYNNFKPIGIPSY